jgi:ATP-dependent DNA helicase RecG
MSQQTQLALFDDIPSVEILLAKREDQWFDRKSIRTADHKIANAMIGFANADGGRIVIGLSDGKVEGIDAYAEQHNALLQAAINLSVPPVRHSVHYVECVNGRGQNDRLLIIDIEASEHIHRNMRDECYLRVGDETRHLRSTEERELAFDKGEAAFDKTIVPDLALEELDLEAVAAYGQQIGVLDVKRTLRIRGLYFDGPYKRGVTQAGQLLFGITPPIWAYVRYLRYDGVTAETGTRLNLIEDVRLEGTIPSLIEQAKSLLSDELKVIRQTERGRFEKISLLPMFAWLEAVVNALTHRSYNVQGDGIRITQFSDRLVVENPGRLPSTVRVDNIRNARYSRNPHIARVLAEMTDYVRETNEGVRRMFQEMKQYGLRDPVYEVLPAGVRVTLYKEPDSTKTSADQNVVAALATLRRLLGSERLEALLAAFRQREQLPTRAIAELLKVSSLSARRYLTILGEASLIDEVTQSKYDPRGYWTRTDHSFWLPDTRL